MDNLGKANVKVELFKSLLGVTKNPTEFNFDITAQQWSSIEKSPYFPPQLAEYVGDTNGSFGAIFPTRRKYYIDNYMSYSGAPTPPSGLLNVEWRAINNYANLGIVTDLAAGYPTYTLIQPGAAYPRDYIGPEWNVLQEGGPAQTSDRQTLIDWSKSLYNPSTGTSYLTDLIQRNAKDNIARPYLSWIHQQKCKDGLWWGIESSEFLPKITKNRQVLSSMPFCVNFKILQRPPPSASVTTTTTTSVYYTPPVPGAAPVVNPVTSNYETQFIISLGKNDPANQFDIVLKHNAKPYIVDYTLGRAASSSASTAGTSIIIKEFESDLSKLWDSEDEIEVCVMTIAGRLVVWVNKVYMIYTRVNKNTGDDAGKIQECKIASGGISIYGSNVQAKINACPLTFAPFGFFAMPITDIIQDADSAPENITWKGVDNRGTIAGSVCILPQQPDKPGELFGVDCYVFDEQSMITIGGSAPIMPPLIFPNGFAFHCMGKIYFLSAGAAGITIFSNSGFYIIAMQSTPIDPDLLTSQPNASLYTGILNWACPFYFRLKGAYRRNQNVIETEILYPKVMSLTESMSAPDYFHALANANVVIYNKGGEFDDLLQRQYGIRISWGWGDEAGDLIQTFLGVVVSASNSEVAGKEVMTLQCEDYMFILKNTPIVISPFYDGMVAYYALADLAKRGGITTCFNDINSPDDYFLPSGYTFSQPVMRFPSSNMLFQCMMEIVKRFEVFIYFDAQGQFHVFGLPGGLFSDTTTEPIVSTFSRDPDQVDPSNIILNERNVEYNFASTVNVISVLSVERDTRNAILYEKAANPVTEDHLTYRRVFLNNQAAFGDLESVRTWAARLGKRVFFPIRKTSFMTVGNTNIGNTDVLSFVEVDSLEYRILSITKKYDAASNDFTLEYTTEWLGGR